MQWLNIEVAILICIGTFFILPAVLALFFHSKAPASYQLLWALVSVLASWLGYFAFRQWVYLPWLAKHHVKWENKQHSRFSSDRENNN